MCDILSVFHVSRCDVVCVVLCDVMCNRCGVCAMCKSVPCVTLRVALSCIIDGVCVMLCV